MTDETSPLSRRILATWERIRRVHGGDTTQRQRLEAASGRDLWAFIDGQGRVGVSVDVRSAEVPAVEAYPTTRSFVTHPASRGDQTRISVHLEHESWKDIFAELCGDVFNWCLRSNSDREIVQRLVERLTAWKAMFVHMPQRPLSENRQAGLWGELHLLNESLRELTLERAVSCWQGPLEDPHDFHFGTTHVEVKTRRVDSRPGVVISSLEQLDPGDANHLLLLALEVKVQIDGRGTSLPELIAHLKERMSDDKATLAAFEQKLLLAGYLTIHEERYQGIGYEISSERAMQVDEGFPALTFDTVPRGVLMARYTLDLSEVPADYDIPVADMHAMIGRQGE